MPYIGKTPTVGNFQVCDAISVVNGQAAYTLQVGGVNVAPESANHMLVSLNGILQKPGSSFTISGSTMTFASNLATGDVIDFVQILGNVLDFGAPSDDSVTAVKLNNDIISGQTALASEPADTDEFLVSDAGTIKRIDYSLIKATTPGWVKIGDTVTASATSTVDFDDLASTYQMYAIIGSQIRPTTTNVNLLVSFGTDGSTYSANKTSAYYSQYNNESDSDPGHDINAGYSLGNSSTEQVIGYGLGNNGTYGKAGQMVAYFSGIGQGSNYGSFFIQVGYWGDNNYAYQSRVNGHIQAAADCIRFQMSSGTIAAGKFTLYGINQ